VPTEEEIDDPTFRNMDPVPDVYESDGLHAGHLPRLLWGILSGLGHTQKPVYRGVKKLYPGYVEWKVEVTIYDYERSQDEGMEVRRVVGIHSAMVPRATFTAGVRDAARQAISRVRDQYNNKMDNSPYAYCPHRTRGSDELFVKSTFGENPKLREQVALTMALEDELNCALWELGEVRQHLAFVSASLEDEQDANQEESEDDEEDLSIHSPPRKRICFNTPAASEDGSVDSSPSGSRTREESQ
jgi:hypothetical protein